MRGAVEGQCDRVPSKLVWHVPKAGQALLLEPISKKSHCAPANPACFRTWHEPWCQPGWKEQGWTALHPMEKNFLKIYPVI